MPPVPKVIFAGPGRTQPWPTSDACWSPTSAAIGGAPGSAVAGPTIPLVSTSVGSIRDGIRSASSAPGCQPEPSAREERGDRGVARVGHVVGALGERPRDPRVDGADAQVPRPIGVERVEDALDLGGRGVGREAEPGGAVGEAADDRTEVLPALRRADGHSVARSHTTAEPRWLVIPTAATGSPCAASVARAASSDDRRHRRRVELDHSGFGGVGQERAVLLVEHRGVVAHDRGADRRRADVADEEVHAVCLDARRVDGCVSRARPGRRRARPGVGQAELAGVQDAVRIERPASWRRARRTPVRAPRGRTASG